MNSRVAVWEAAKDLVKKNAFYAFFFLYRLFCDYIPGGSVSYIVLLLVILVCYKKDHIRIIRAEALMVFLSLLYTVPAALAGITDTNVYTERNLIRSGMRMGHPNWLSADLFYLLVLLYIGHVTRTRKGILLACAGVYAICEYITRTRTVSMLCLLFVAVVLVEFIGTREKGKGIIGAVLSFVVRAADLLAVFAFPIICAICMGLVYALSKGYGFAYKLNDTLAGRVSLALKLINRHGITPFGTLFQEAKAGYTEMEYAQILVRIGVVGLLAFGLVWVFISLRCFRKGRRRLLYCMALISVYAVTEGFMLTDTGNVFLFLALVDLSEKQTDVDEDKRIDRKRIAATVASYIPFLAMIGFMPFLFDRMRTIVQLVSVSGEDVLPRICMVIAFFILFLPAWGLSALIRECVFGGSVFGDYVAGERTSRGFVFGGHAAGGLFSRAGLTRFRLIVTGVCAAVVFTHLIYGGIIIRRGSDSEEVSALIDADTPAIETILAAKTGKFYVDPYPALYRKRFPEIAYRVLYGKDLARGKNTTVLTDIDLDGGNTFSTQGFFYAPISDAHAVYSNDEAVIAAMTEAGYPVTPFFAHRRHVDLEQCARDSYLVYEPAFSGIYIDQTVEGYQSQNVWTNYNRLYEGTYEATFTCRLLMPEENAPEETCILAVNLAHQGEYARSEITPADADENGRMVQTVPFNVPGRMHGDLISFSVYGGNIRRLIVEDISYIRVG